MENVTDACAVWGATAYSAGGNRGIYSRWDPHRVLYFISQPTGGKCNTIDAYACIYTTGKISYTRRILYAPRVKYKYTKLFEFIFRLDGDGC